MAITRFLLQLTNWDMEMNLQQLGSSYKIKEFIIVIECNNVIGEKERNRGCLKGVQYSPETEYFFSFFFK